MRHAIEPRGADWCFLQDVTDGAEMAKTPFTKPRGVSQGRASLFVALAVAGLLVLVIYVLPPVLVRPDGPLTAAERLRAENDVRTTLLQAIAGAILLAGLYFTARTLQINTRTLELNREGQITERFTRAIDQLGQPGAEKLDVRLGGIYALERIAATSREDHGPVMDVLAAFVREQARWQLDHTPARKDTGLDSEPNYDATGVRPRADVQAAMTVLGRRNRDFVESGRVLELSGVDLRGADLRGAHLERVALREAHLEEADLGGAYLTGASLRAAHLERAVLLGVRLEGADLGDAHLEGASLRGARLEDAALGGAHLEGADLADSQLQRAFLSQVHLEGANLSYAVLEGAFLPGAHLGHAVLYGAHLAGADFHDADLDEANISRTDLSGVQGLSREQINSAITDEGTTLPALD
jgi:uncharacterized protein YjbI with pentapeptide repeats